MTLSVVIFVTKVSNPLVSRLVVLDKDGTGGGGVCVAVVWAIVEVGVVTVGWIVVGAAAAVEGSASAVSVILTVTVISGTV